MGEYSSLSSCCGTASGGDGNGDGISTCIDGVSCVESIEVTPSSVSLMMSWWWKTLAENFEDGTFLKLFDDRVDG